MGSISSFKRILLAVDWTLAFILGIHHEFYSCECYSQRTIGSVVNDLRFMYRKALYRYDPSNRNDLTCCLSINSWNTITKTHQYHMQYDNSFCYCIFYTTTTIPPVDSHTFLFSQKYVSKAAAKSKIKQQSNAPPELLLPCEYSTSYTNCTCSNLHNYCWLPIFGLLGYH